MAIGYTVFTCIRQMRFCGVAFQNWGILQSANASADCITR